MQKKCSAPDPSGELMTLPQTLKSAGRGKPLPYTLLFDLGTSVVGTLEHKFLLMSTT